MTNNDYYIGFQNNDKNIIAIFYEKFAYTIKQQLRTKYSSLYLDDDFLADIYQETIIRLWENIHRNRITIGTLTTNIAGYLYGIGENVLREQLRRNKELSIEDFPPLSDTNDDVLQYEVSERSKAIKETVNKMDKPCAPLLLKFYWEGYSMDEIAIQLGYANANSAKTQKNKCMNKLKAIFKSL